MYALCQTYLKEKPARRTVIWIHLAMGKLLASILLKVGRVEANTYPTRWDLSRHATVGSQALLATPQQGTKLVLTKTTWTINTLLNLFDE
jgi:hypothetical protein